MKPQGAVGTSLYRPGALGRTLVESAVDTIVWPSKVVSIVSSRPAETSSTCRREDSTEERSLRRSGTSLRPLRK
jgi:hypothetical protein